MLSAATIKLLRIPFSVFLSPLYFFALSQVPDINWGKTALIFFILHLLIYPASNGYNSYMDRDTESIGGLEKPPPPSRQLFLFTIVLDIVAIGLSFLRKPTTPDRWEGPGSRARSQATCFRFWSSKTTPNVQSTNLKTAGSANFGCDARPTARWSRTSTGAGTRNQPQTPPARLSDSSPPGSQNTFLATNAETPLGVVRRWFAGPDDGSQPLELKLEIQR